MTGILVILLYLPHVIYPLLSNAQLLVNLHYFLHQACVHSHSLNSYS